MPWPTPGRLNLPSVQHANQGWRIYIHVLTKKKYVNLYTYMYICMSTLVCACVFSQGCVCVITFLLSEYYIYIYSVHTRYIVT